MRRFWIFLVVALFYALSRENAALGAAKSELPVCPSSAPHLSPADAVAVATCRNQAAQSLYYDAQRAEIEKKARNSFLGGFISNYSVGFGALVAALIAVFSFLNTVWAGLRQDRDRQLSDSLSRMADKDNAQMRASGGGMVALIGRPSTASRIWVKLLRWGATPTYYVIVRQLATALALESDSAVIDSFASDLEMLVKFFPSAAGREISRVLNVVSPGNVVESIAAIVTVAEAAKTSTEADVLRQVDSALRLGEPTSGTSLASLYVQHYESRYREALALCRTLDWKDQLDARNLANESLRTYATRRRALLRLLHSIRICLGLEHFTDQQVGEDFLATIDRYAPQAPSV